MSKQGVRDIAIALGLVALIVAARLLPHPGNAAPVISAALFAGFLFRGRGWVGAIATLAAVLISDAFIGFYDPRLMAVVYLCSILPVVLSRFIGARPRIAPVAATTVGSSLFFFIVTNLAVWAFGSETIYPHTPAGLLACYIAALPFLAWGTLGALAYSAGLFGGYAMITRSAASPLAAVGTRSAARA